MAFINKPIAIAGLRAVFLRFPAARPGPGLFAAIEKGFVMMNHEISSSVGNVEFRRIRGIRGFRGCVAMLLTLVCWLLPLSPARGAILDIFGNVLDPRDPAPGVDYSGVFWDNADLRGLDLTGVSFRSARLRNAHFQNAIIRNVDFSDFATENSNFEGASFVNTLIAGHFIASTFRGVDFRQAGVEVDGAVKIRASFWVSDLSMADFSGTHLSSVYFAGVSIEGADFTGAILNNVHIGNLEFGEAGTFIETNATNSKFRDVLFIESSILSDQVVGADFSGATGDLTQDPSYGRFDGAFYDLHTDLAWGAGSLPYDYLELGFILIPEPSLIWLVGGIGAGAMFLRRRDQRSVA